MDLYEQISKAAKGLNFDTFSLFFDVEDEQEAKSIISRLQRNTELLKELFCTIEFPFVTICIFRRGSQIESLLPSPLNENQRYFIEYDSSTIFQLVDDNYNQDETIKNIGYFLFDKLSKDTSEHRSAFWIKHGYAMQLVYDSLEKNTELLGEAFETIKKANADKKLVPLRLLIKDTVLSSGAQKMQLVNYQTYFLVKLLRNTYCDKFFSKYVAMLTEFSDLNGEQCFTQAAGFSYSRLYSYFCDWLNHADTWKAVE